MIHSRATSQHDTYMLNYYGDGNSRFPSQDIKMKKPKKSNGKIDKAIKTTASKADFKLDPHTGLPRKIYSEKQAASFRHNALAVQVAVKVP